ncbi:MAG: tRNA (adenosine(37)-N6)-threonylcarbamoyltransferase complex ATPase subunit type 1 TsaE [Anaerolineae bacterium]
MPILREGELDLISHSAEQTRRLGARLGALLQPGDVVCLSGDLGAGKTAFAAGIGAGWGAKVPVTSPTFNLVHEHERDGDGQILYHLDCYRIHTAADALTIGLDDILSGNGPVVIEWPEHIEAALPTGGCGSTCASSSRRAAPSPLTPPARATNPARRISRRVVWSE